MFLVDREFVNKQDLNKTSIHTLTCALYYRLMDSLSNVSTETYPWKSDKTVYKIVMAILKEFAERNPS
jgi:hypothetical protein